MGGEQRDYIKETQENDKLQGVELLESAKSWDAFTHSMRSGTSQFITINKRLEFYIDDVVVRVARIRELLYYPNDVAVRRLKVELMSCIKTSIVILDKMWEKAADVQQHTDKLVHFINQILEAAEFGALKIRQEQLKNNKNGLVYAEVSCELWNLCGLIGRPKPITEQEVTTLLDTLNEAVRIRKIYVAAFGLLTGSAVCYFALCLLAFVVMGRLCECTVFQRHLNACGGEIRTTVVDVYSSALANVSNVIIYHDAYNDLSSDLFIASFSTYGISGALKPAEDRRYHIETTRRLVQGYGKQLDESRAVLEDLKFSFNHAPHEINMMQTIVDATKGTLDKLGVLLGQLSESAQYSLDVIQDDKVHRTRDGMVYPHVSCEWATLCGLLWRPRPFGPYEMSHIPKELSKVARHGRLAGDAIGTIQTANETNQLILRETRQALLGILMGANKTGEPHWEGDKNAILMELRRGRTKLQDRFSDLSTIRDSFKVGFEKRRPLNRPVPSFKFPRLDATSLGNTVDLYRVTALADEHAPSAFAPTLRIDPLRPNFWFQKNWTEIKKVVHKLRDEAISLLERPSTPEVKPVPSKPADSSSVPSAPPTPSFVPTASQQPSPAILAFGTGQDVRPTGSVVDSSSLAVATAPATASEPPVSASKPTEAIATASSTNPSDKSNPFDEINQPSLFGAVQPTSPSFGSNVSATQPTSATAMPKKRPNPPEKSELEVEADKKRPRTPAPTSRTVRIGELDSRERPIKIEGVVYVFRHPVTFVGLGLDPVVNPVENPGKLWRDADFPTAGYSRGLYFTRGAIMTLLALRVVDAKGNNASESQLKSASFSVIDASDA
ncbi:uncharacterized protein PG986_003755 [Apiospora aurea]|uniref:Uncharacterized protein n=1 Tax=Apiospora aurea TaxID=335848 RepID=A0ABR1QSL1_9PEZI